MSGSSTDSSRKKRKPARKGTCICWDNISRAINHAIESAFAFIGGAVARWPCPVILLVVILLAAISSGYTHLSFSTNVFELWRPFDSPVWDEEEFIHKYWADKDYGLMVISATDFNEDTTVNIMTGPHLQEWYEFHLNWATTLPAIDYPYTDTNGDPRSVPFNYFPADYVEPPPIGAIATGVPATQWGSGTVPFCRLFARSPLEAQFELPCYIFSMFDCFTEGGYFFPWAEYLAKSFFTSLVPANPYTYKPSFQGLTQVELGAIFAPSCKIWSQTTIPSNIIYGGETRVNNSDASSLILSMSAFETAFYIDSAAGIARKMQIVRGECMITAARAIDCAAPAPAHLKEAEQFLDDWLKQYIVYMEKFVIKYNKDKTHLLRLQFWTPRTSRDLLVEASSADFGLLAIAYVAMIVFASLTAMRFNGFLSRSEASFAGVLLVLCANVATIGLASFFVDLSPNVIQVLPFIALGFGVDDMFVLLFAFKFREKLTVHEMIRETVRIAGSSVALTSLANFFAFLIGSFMNLPDIVVFSICGMLIVVLNFIAVIFGFTAVLTLTARRMESGYKDWSFLCCFAECMKSNKKYYEKPSADAASMFDPLFDWLTKTYTRVIFVILFFALAGIGGYGITLITPGLPLADIVPQTHYGSEFLAIREAYFHTYPIDIYSDANLKSLTPIDWPNRFADWLTITHDVYSISDLVYDDPGVHSFWAWKLEEYLQEQYVAYFEPFAMGYFPLPDSTTYLSRGCEADRMAYCASLDVHYEEGSDLYYCLNSRLPMLSTLCAAYMGQITSEFVFPYAEQIYLQDYTSDAATKAVGGLYVRPSGSAIQVFWKYPDSDGYIYQPSCVSATSSCPWFVLDASHNKVYTGLSTYTDEQQPSIAGWTAADTGAAVPVIHLYFDYTIFYLGFDRPELFLYADVSAPTSFTFTRTYIPGATAANAKNALIAEPLRLLMGEYSSYSDITLSVDSDSVKCAAVTDTSELCKSFRDETTLGHIECGSLEGASSVRPRTPVSEWYTDALCDASSSWSIMAIDADMSDQTVAGSDFSSVGCGCDTPSTWNGTLRDAIANHSTSVMYFSPSAANSNNQFGASVLPGGADGMCGQTQHEMSVTCTAMADCTQAEVCLADYAAFMKVFSAAACNTQQVLQFIDTRDGGLHTVTDTTRPLALCLYSEWSSLSTCCQEALTTIQLSGDTVASNVAFSCNLIWNWARHATDFNANFANLCNAKDRCAYTTGVPTGTRADCQYWCYDDVWADCQYVSDHYSCVNASITDMAERQTAYWDCLQTNRDEDDSGCCTASMNNNVAFAGCSMEVSTYYSAALGRYDYSMCLDSDVPAVCGTTNEGTTLQLTCLQENVGLLPNDTCCAKAVLGSTNSFSYTRECAQDVVNVCGISAGIGSLFAACQAGLIQAAAAGFLSPNCKAVLADYCLSDDGLWPPTVTAATATIACPSGSTGNQTRVCSSVSGAAVWGAAVITGCVPVSCVAVTEFGVDWPQTLGGYVTTLLGPEVPATLSDTFLQCASCNISCANLLTHTYFARRRCTIAASGLAASWDAPTVDCRSYTSWDIAYEGYTCDLYSYAAGLGVFFGNQQANLIAALPDYYLGFDATDALQRAYFLGTVQSICTAQLANCAAFTYDASTRIAYLYDFCPVVSSDALYGVVETVVNGGRASITSALDPLVHAELDPVLELLRGVFVSACTDSVNVDVDAFALVDVSLDSYYSTCSSDAACCAQDFIDFLFGLGLTAAVDDYIATTIASTWVDAQVTAKASFPSMSTYIAPLELLPATAQYCSLKNGFAFMPSQVWSAVGVPRSECFNNLLWAFFIDPTGGVLYQDKMFFSDSNKMFDTTAIDEINITTTYNSFMLRGLDDDQIAVDFILTLRKRLKTWKADKLYVIPGGLVINLYSQYIGVEDSLSLNLAWVSIALVLCGCIFLLNPIAVLVALMCNVAMIVEVYGFCDWLGLRINGVLVLNMVIAIGLTMEFTAHMARAFVLTTGEGKKIGLPFADEGQIRLKKTMREMFTPVSLGALTTLLGVAPISAAKFPYFRQYYFTMYVMIVFFGWLNGVIFQPIILSLYPPAPFVEEAYSIDDEEEATGTATDTATIAVNTEYVTATDGGETDGEENVKVPLNKVKQSQTQTGGKYDTIDQTKTAQKSTKVEMQATDTTTKSTMITTSTADGNGNSSDDADPKYTKANEKESLIVTEESYSASTEERAVDLPQDLKERKDTVEP